MSQLFINEFLAELDRNARFTGSTNEQTIREAFKSLLRKWAKGAGLYFAAELEYGTARGTKVYPDGTILHEVRVPLGFWEAKDTKDDLDTEIADKFRKGYPQDNILFENSETAILWQNRREIMRCSMRDTDDLGKLLTLFFAYERPEIADFRKAVGQFKTDLPAVLDALREKIAEAYKTNKNFGKAATHFLDHVKTTVNPALQEADVREMLIQHILTEEIFAHVFNEGDFHRENNIAKELYALESEFFTGAVKKETLAALNPYYAAIRANAAQITGHGEKQTFLKVIYENFYKVYNPKAADRLGVVYTPNEIVRFMIEGADWLCHKHFGKSMIEPGVEILDPATGTGTFICELIEHFAGDKKKLAHKYKEELHANEVAILPYYVANLNIEATYASVSGQFAEFPNLCFVDTLDNVEGLGIKSGHQHDMFSAFSDENIERVQRQNRKDISVVIGNPPYNANQKNENENNKNRKYPHMDQRVKNTFIKRSTAQKTKLYDPYAIFFRWALDRLGDEGIIAFISNSSFINARTFDGFRAVMAENFSEIYVVDLKGDARTSGEQRRREGGNVFDDQIRVGVAISFWVKKREHKGCVIRYEAVRDYAKADEKQDFVSLNPLSAREFDTITPSKRGNWINQVENEWDDLIPVGDKKTKSAKSRSKDRSIFRLFSFGLVTNRDEWIYDRSITKLANKMEHLVEVYEHDRANIKRKRDGKLDVDNLSSGIKWTRSVKRNLEKGQKFDLSNAESRTTLYRPFDKQQLLFYPPLIEMLNQTRTIFGKDGKSENQTIVFTDPTSQKPFMVMSSDILIDMHLVGAAAGASALPRYSFTEDGERQDNITDWALNKFKDAYKGQKLRITKDAIFHYVYAVLHDPAYREIYAINLKREFPRIPFYPDFLQWAAWGERLMDLHIGYESVEPWPLERTDTEDNKSRAAGLSPKVTLKADKEKGTICLDSETALSGIPPEAWDYRLGNRSGLEWILDQYKQKKPRDPTIREKFNTYRFADYKEHVIDLLMRVTGVSVETIQIVTAMRNAKRE